MPTRLLRVLVVRSDSLRAGICSTSTSSLQSKQITNSCSRCPTNSAQSAVRGLLLEQDCVRVADELAPGGNRNLCIHNDDDLAVLLARLESRWI